MSDKSEHRVRRHRRVRKKVRGSADRPRLAVYRSNRHLYAQLIDDASGVTIAAASSLDPDLKTNGADGRGEAPGRIGKLLAERAQAKGISVVVFDRGGFKFHGRIKKLADSAREQGLQF